MNRTEQLVQQLASAARGRPPVERSNLLDRRCGNSPELRSLVEQRLLAEEAADDATIDWSGPASPNNPAPSSQSPGNVGRFLPGQVIAQRFNVIRYIDRGGMGEVYEVEDRLLQHAHVALKMILPTIASDPTSSRRFEQEVLLARKVIHPNLCPIYDIARSDSDDPPPPFLFLTMKLLSGETLKSRLSRADPILRPEATAIFRQMVAGLAAIHAAGIIHRDIKPNNVMLDYSGPELCLSIMDFGLARLHQQDETMATNSLIAGTPGYMAPEVLQGQGPSQAADIFALGVLLHQVLTRERPHAGSSSSIEPSPALDTADAPAGLILAVKEFLSTDPNRRCLAFDQISAATTSNSRLDVWQPASPRPFSRRHFIVGGSVVTACAVAAAQWKWYELYDVLHPLPVKRFVALLGWPTPRDPRIAPTITAVVDAVGSELSRAEASDHNLFIIPHFIGKEIASLQQVNDVRESLGANLVLSASAVLVGNQLELILKVLDPAAARTLRQRTIRVPMDDQLALPQKAVLVAADLLGIAKSQLADERRIVGTNNPEAYAAFQTAEGLRRQENDAGLEGAIEQYKQAINIDPHYALANAKLALAYFRLYILHRNSGDLALARANCNAALTEDHNLVDAHLALAFVLGYTGDKPGGLREISKALSIDPGNPSAMLTQGQELTRSNQWHKAEEAFARLQTARPNFWLAHEEMGVVYGAEGKYRQAADAFQAANTAAPKRTLPLANLSTANLLMGNSADALKIAEECLKLAMNDPGAAAKAAAFSGQGKFNQALPFALQAVKLNPDYPGHWLDLGDIYSRIRGRQAEAKDAFSHAAKLLEQTVQTDPTDGPDWMSLALAQAKTKQPEKSLQSLRTADGIFKSLKTTEDNFEGDLDSQLTKVRTLELLGKRDEAIATATACKARGATPFQFQTMPDIDGLRNEMKSRGLLVT